MTVPSATAKETTKMKITTHLLRHLIKEAIGTQLGGLQFDIEFITGDLDSYDPKRLEDVTLTDKEINTIQSALQKDNPGAEFIVQMDPKFGEKVQDRSYGNRKNLYIDQGKSQDGKKLYFKKVEGDPQGKTYGVVHLS